MINPSSGNTPNIVVNHDFSYGLSSWHPNCCSGLVLVVPNEAGGGGKNTAVLTNRTQWWQGLEQDITARISSGSTYTVLACVGVSGPLSFTGSTVLATLKLETHGSAPSFLFIGKTFVSKGRWEMVEGKFSLSAIPDRLVFYLEGPPPGVELLIRSVVITCSNSSRSESSREGCEIAGDENIVLNPHFEDGLNNWSGKCCEIVLHDSMAQGKIAPHSGKVFVAATGRTRSWNGIQKEITARLQPKAAYNVAALVRICGRNVTSATVQATLWVQTPDGRELYIMIANVQATDDDWVQLQGKFFINFSTSRVVIYIEGPPAGTDILLNTLVVKRAEKIPASPPLAIEEFHSAELRIEEGVAHSRPTWEMPPQGYVKINFGGALKEGAKFGGVGVVIRGDMGEMKGAAAIPFPGVSHLETIEALGAIEAAEFGLKMGFTKIILEGDALGIISQLNSNSPNLSTVGNLIADARSLLANFQQVRVMHVKRQGNEVAHLLAEHALCIDGRMIWVEDGPDFIQNVLEADVKTD